MISQTADGYMSRHQHDINVMISYVLTGDEHYLDLRAFPDKIKLAVWEKQNHRCAICGKDFDMPFMEGDHFTPWREGGRTVVENC